MRVILNDYEPKYIIKFIRQATGLTQEQFGNKIGKSKDTVQSYELGRNKISLDDFISICKLFNFKMTIEEKVEVKSWI